MTLLLGWTLLKTVNPQQMEEMQSFLTLTEQGVVEADWKCWEVWRQELLSARDSLQRCELMECYIGRTRLRN